MSGFFSSSVLDSKPPTSLIPKCGACGLYKKCQSPKLEPVGQGKRKVLIVYEAPCDNDDTAGRLLSRPNSSLPLETAIRKCSGDILRDCWVTTALICHTGGKPPTPDQIDYCRPNLIKTINTLQPNVIIPLGTAGVGSLLPYIWKGSIGVSNRWFGLQIPCQELNAWVCPSYSPAYVNHAINSNHMKAPVLRIHFNKHIANALKHDGKPWDTVPDYRKEITIVQEPRKAAAQIRKMIKRGGAVAFDYETDRIKPDNKESRIVSASVCWRGKHTIAFPWHGDAVTAVGELLRSPLPKIGCNLKFEDRWTRRHLGHRVRNWYWDTMLAAHVIDNQPGITSIKFQAFALLGAPSYDGHIKKFLQGIRGQESNQIDLIETKDLLLYNGLDSLLQYKVAIKQMEILEHPLP